MSAFDGGGPAFPTDNAAQVGPSTYHFDGMSLRDYFAAKAMQGICASKDEAGTLIEHGYDWIAREAFRIADAMLRARNA